MSKIKKPDASNNIGTDFRKLGGYANSTHSSLYSVDMPRGSESDNGQDTQLQGRQSLFNLYNLYTGAGDGIWLDEDLQNNKAFTMPTARTLIEHPRGQVIYDWSDFAYCTYYGKIPNNRLITLRRFAQPVMDDITNTYAHPSPDVARMVTWFDGENNKLEDLMSMSFGLNWKTLKSSVEEGRVVGGGQDGVNGWMRTVAKMLDPKFSEESVKGKARLSIAPNHDANKVYGPIDVIDQTTIRDRGLKFDQSLQLKFFYSCKSIDGINAKSAMIDCLSNVLATTYNNAKFWGGARYWTGPRPSAFWNEALKVEQTVIDKTLAGSFSDLFNYFKGLGEQIMNSMKGNGVDTLKSIASVALKRFAVAKMLNIVGRPSLPVMNSLLKGDPIGEWHLMIGNPMRPVMCIGNLVLDNVNITPVSSELGYDDFPTDFVVTVTLKHAMPRDKAGIESMLTAGKGRTYWKPSDSDFASIVKALQQAKTANAVGIDEYNKVFKNVHDFVNTPAAKAEVDALNKE